MPRLNPGTQGSQVVATVTTKDRLADGVQGSSVAIGTAAAGARTSPGTQGSPVSRRVSTAPPSGRTWSSITTTWTAETATWDGA